MLKLRGRLAGSLSAESGEPEINMAPLIDMVFILLIFFLVTTSFVRETGVKVERPHSATATAVKKKSLLVGLDPKGRIFVDHRRVELAALRGLVERFISRNPGGAVVMVADRATPAGVLVRIMDQCRRGGAGHIALGAKRERP